MLLMLAGLGAELVLVVLGLLSVSWLRNRAARRRDVKAMAALVARVRKGKAERLAALRTFLQDRLGLEDDARDQLAAALRHTELTMLKRFVAVYRGRDAATAGRFDNDLYEAIAPYHELSGATVVTAEPARPAIVDPTELEALREENQRLSDELKITMETMSRMLNEYSTMFSGNEPVPVVPIGATAPATAAPEQVPDGSTGVGAATNDDSDIDVVIETADEVVPEVVAPAAVDPAGDQLPDGSPEVGAGATDDSDVDVVNESAEQIVKEAVAPAAPLQADNKVSEPAADNNAPQVDDRSAVVSDALEGDASAIADASEALGQGAAGAEEQADRAPRDSEDLAKPSLNTTSPDVVENEVVAATAEPVTVAAVGDEAEVVDADLPADEVGLFDDAPFDKGADVEAVSELLAAGDTERVTSKGIGLDDATADEGLFDGADDDLFDTAADVSPDNAAASNPAVQANLAATDKMDDLFDVDDLLTGQPDARRGDAKQA